MANSTGTGEHNGFGADVIRFPAGGDVANHTHEGDHILFGSLRFVVIAHLVSQ
jgi:hypothetical protein